MAYDKLEPENGNRIGNLSKTFPTINSLISHGDDHIRAIKRAITSTWRGLSKDDDKLTVNGEQIDNSIKGLVIGMMRHHDISVAPIPTNWALCDGKIHNGYQTKDMRSMFVISKDSSVSTQSLGVKSKRDENLETLGHALHENEMPTHIHQMHAQAFMNGFIVHQGDGSTLTRSLRLAGVSLTSNTLPIPINVPHKHKVKLLPVDKTKSLEPEHTEFPFIVFTGYK